MRLHRSSSVPARRRHPPVSLSALSADIGTIPHLQGVIAVSVQAKCSDAGICARRGSERKRCGTAGPQSRPNRFLDPRAGLRVQ
jgi:hypothetical protein